MTKKNRDLAIIVLGRIFQFIFALLSVRLTTTLLGPGQIGRMNLLLGINSWFGLLLISPVGNYVFRQTLEWNTEGRLLQSLRHYTFFLIGVAIAALITLTALYFVIGIGIEIQLNWLLFLVVASLFFGVLSATYVIIINLLGYRGWYVLFSNLSSWLGLGAAVILALWVDAHAEYWMSGLLIGQTIIMIAAGLVLYRISNKLLSKIDSVTHSKSFDLQSVFQFSWPLIIATAFYWFQNSGYRFVLVSLSNEQTVGLFTTGMAIAMSPMVMFDTLFTEYYRPIFYRDITYSNNQTQAEASNRYVSAYFPAIILVAVYMALGGPFLARILVSESFQQVSWLAVWGAILQASIMVYATYSSLVFASLNTKVMIWPNISGAIVALVSLLVLVPSQTLLGVGIALSLGMITTIVHLLQILQRDFTLSIPWRRLISAGLLSLPLIIGFEVAKLLCPNTTLMQAIIVLGVSGIYLLISQFILARTWLFQHDTPIVTSQVVTS